MEYKTKFLSEKIYMKQMLKKFKMEEGKIMEENLDVFSKLKFWSSEYWNQHLRKDQAIYLINNLPKPYELVHILKYVSGKVMITVKKVTIIAYSKESDLKEIRLLIKPWSKAKSLCKDYKRRSEKRGEGNHNKGILQSQGKSSSRFKCKRCFHMW